MGGKWNGDCMAVARLQLVGWDSFSEHIAAADWGVTVGNLSLSDKSGDVHEYEICTISRPPAIYALLSQPSEHHGPMTASTRPSSSITLSPALALEESQPISFSAT